MIRQADETREEMLDRIEREAFDSVVAPTVNPRDLLEFVRTLFLPPDRAGEPAKAYDPESHQIQMMLLLMFTSPRWRKFVIVACTQDGKSWVIQMLLFWLTCELREAVVVGGPDMRIAQDTWRLKTRPSMEVSGLGEFLPTKGSGSEGGANVETIELNGGGVVILLGAGGKNASGQAGRTARWVIVDEFGKVKRALASKFDRRADSYDEEGRIVKAGTVESDHEDPLLEAYDDSSKGHAVYRCHLCQEFTGLEWGQVSADYTSEVSAAATVRIACARCGKEWTDAERRRNLPTGQPIHDGQTIDSAGQISGELPATFVCGMRWGALDSPRRSLSKLAVLYREAMIAYERGNAQPLIDFWHDQMATRAPIDDGSEQLDTHHLAARSAASDFIVVRLLTESGGEAHGWIAPRLPHGVVFTTAAVDQSLRRLWWTLRGHDLEGRTWTIGYGRIPICGDMETPTESQRHAALDKLRAFFAKGVLDASDELKGPAVVGLDIAEFTAESFRWLANAPGWMPLHGTGARQAQGMAANEGKVQIVLAGWYTLRTYEKNGAGSREILWIDSDRVKTELSRALQREPGSTGAAHLPQGLDPKDELLFQLTGERWEKAPGGRFTWVKRGKRVDLWDAHYYTQALGRYIQDQRPDLAIPTPQVGSAHSDRDDDDRHGGVDLSW